MSEQQVESYELQKVYYEEMVERHPNWNLIDIYPDEGISATSMKQRKNFLRMIEDCKKGEISMIVTKSVSRFARNVVDAISTIRTRDVPPDYLRPGRTQQHRSERNHLDWPDNLPRSMLP